MLESHYLLAVVASKGGVGVCREVAPLGREKTFPDPATSLEEGEERRWAPQAAPPAFASYPSPSYCKTSPAWSWPLSFLQWQSSALPVLLRSFEVAVDKQLLPFILQTQALMSRQWHHGHQTVFGDELRVCFRLPYSKCTNWVKDCSSLPQLRFLGGVRIFWTFSADFGDLFCLGRTWHF